MARVITNGKRLRHRETVSKTFVFIRDIRGSRNQPSLLFEDSHQPFLRRERHLRTLVQPLHCLLCPCRRETHRKPTDCHARGMGGPKGFVGEMSAPPQEPQSPPLPVIQKQPLTKAQSSQSPSIHHPTSSIPLRALRAEVLVTCPLFPPLLLRINK